ncbi:Vacuolar protein sorting-associated protein-like protein [Emericellopsis cladophorae]|uniref:Vacuolar protein sorting-associated protein-like protein n=1 Tax=Emericellopsis cladophorae TaxID=2686198 RepID=A0A9P9Y713_9HYPO|nr:Vacuolar protein sorting-associated protein-like protein [Emericellopsis cladophorae]KAI6784591.1 Vacuolar protein sorting-associated protein-like protein [Emericellopsis cladophorae]
MAEALPESLKIPEVSRFIKRAGQLRSVKPAVAYWCEYRAVNQIVGKGLHSGEEDAFAFTTNLIDQLEATKAEHAAEDAITDNEVAKVYIEQFAQQTFDRAERTLRADKVTRQTADTFDAAATFFDLLREWGELEPEVLQKIKFAKWNAARILKALREGRDPNESNPKQPEQAEGGEEEGTTGLDPNDLDVEELASLGTVPQPATVQDAPDAGESLGSAGPPPHPPAPEDYFPTGPHPPQPSTPGSVVPPSVPASMPSVAPEGPVSAASSIPPGPSPHLPTKLSSQFAPPPGPAFPGSSASSLPPSVPQQQLSTPSLPQPVPVPAPAPAPSAPPPAAHYKDLNQAQKHAKWAISALNFEDVPTAVQELRNALAALGAQ